MFYIPVVCELSVSSLIGNELPVTRQQVEQAIYTFAKSKSRKNRPTVVACLKLLIDCKVAGGKKMASKQIRLHSFADGVAAAE